MSNVSFSLKRILSEIRTYSKDFGEFVVALNFSRTNENFMSSLVELDNQLSDKYDVYHVACDSSGKLYHIHCRRKENA